MHIILYVLDALRADHLGCYGYKRNTSPNIDALAEEGAVFENCFTLSTWTRPVAASILTGTYPGVHGTCFRNDMFGTSLKRLPEVLKAKGFKTAAFSTMGNIAGNMGFERGFDQYNDIFRHPEILARRRRLDPAHEGLMHDTDYEMALPRAEDINRFLFPWLDQNKEGNSFSFIWSIETHAPYDAPKEHRKFSGRSDSAVNEVARDVIRSSEADDCKTLIDNYDDEILYNDQCLGDIIAYLKKIRIYDESMIVITGDHGDAFYEHQLYGHGHAPYDEVIHVPLIMKFPQDNFKGKRLSGQVELIDIFPTLTAAADIGENEDSLFIQGHDLLPLINGDVDFVRNYSFSDTQPSEVQNRYFSVRDFNLKYIYIERPKRNAETIFKTIKHVFERRLIFKLLRYPKHFIRGYFQKENEYLFDLRGDPDEKKNLVNEKPEILDKFRKILSKWVSENKRIAEQVGGKREEYLEDELTKKHLKDLGYM